MRGTATGNSRASMAVSRSQAEVLRMRNYWYLGNRTYEYLKTIVGTFMTMYDYEQYLFHRF